MRVWTAGPALHGGGSTMRDESIKSSNTLAQNQPLVEIVGHSSQFDSSAVKKNAVREFFGFSRWHGPCGTMSCPDIVLLFMLFYVTCFRKLTLKLYVKAVTIDLRTALRA